MTVLAAVVLMTHIVAEPSTEAFEKARRLYFASEPREALAILDTIARDPTAGKPVEILRYQAYCLFLLELYDEARATWLKILAIDPLFAPDPMQDSPEVVSFFIRVRPSRPSEPATEQGVAQPAPVEEPVHAPLQSTPPAEPITVPPALDLSASDVTGAPPSVRGCGVVLCLLPLGVGQFANRRPVKGTLFALLQAGAIGANVGLYWAQSKRERPTDAYIAAQRGTIIAAGVLIAAGVIDAFVLP